jgi:hypothetical protein
MNLNHHGVKILVGKRESPQFERTFHSIYTYTVDSGGMLKCLYSHMYHTRASPLASERRGRGGQGVSIYISTQWGRATPHPDPTFQNNYYPSPLSCHQRGRANFYLVSKGTLYQCNLFLLYP